jgi:hypothetical protein
MRVSAAKKTVTTQAAMVDGKEGTTKYSKGAKFGLKVISDS